MPRDRRRRFTDNDLIHAVQWVRLKGLETGSLQPLCDREEFYLRLFRAGRRPDPEAFILSRPLFHLEGMQRRAGEDEDVEALPFSPLPEPAISRA